MQIWQKKCNFGSKSLSNLYRFFSYVAIRKIFATFPKSIIGLLTAKRPCHNGKMPHPAHYAHYAYPAHYAYLAHPAQ